MEGIPKTFLKELTEEKQNSVFITTFHMCALQTAG
jgi:hypothetical protein